MSQWSSEDERRFQVALLCYSEDFPNRREKIVEVVGLSREMVYQRYQIHQIELGQVSQPQCTNSSTDNQPHKNNKRSSWTLEEHALFLLGVRKYGQGHWKNISEKAVVTRNATQVASHAQKFYIRQKEKEMVVHSRSSIHDCTLANYPPEYVNHLLSSRPHLMLRSSMVMQQPNSSIHSHLPLHHDHHSLSMAQLGTQIPSIVYQSHQLASPAQYDFQLNQLSTPMNQVGPMNPSDVQLQNLYHQHNSQVVSQLLPMNQGDQYESQQLNQSSTPINQVGPMNASNVQLQNLYHQHNSQVVSQSLPMNQGDQYESQQLNQLSTPMNQVGPMNASDVQLQNLYHQHNSQVVSQSLPMNQGDHSESQYPYHTILPLQNPPLSHQFLPQNYEN